MLLYSQVVLFTVGETLVLGRVVLYRATVGRATAAETAAAVAAGHPRAEADDERAEQVDDVPTIGTILLLLYGHGHDIIGRCRLDGDGDGRWQGV